VAAKLKNNIKLIDMKKILPYITVVLLYVACNDEKKYSNEEADTRQYNTVTKDAEGAKSTVNNNDTTSTTNNNAYNTDSASGQGTTYDSSSNNKKNR
jgi:uncharacterized protein YxeA